MAVSQLLVVLCIHVGTLPLPSLAVASKLHAGVLGSGNGFSFAVRAEAQLMTYEKFLDHFGLHDARAEESQEVVEKRHAAFKLRQTAVIKQNQRKDRRWVAGINRFSDQLPEEQQWMLGYRRTQTSSGSQRFRADGSMSKPSFMAKADGETLASSMDWRGKLNSSQHVRDQGSCGSCWAVATVGALECHAELTEKEEVHIAYNELVDCMPNPHMCGGAGGCQGATSTLAFDYVKDFGLGMNRDLEHEHDCKTLAKESRRIMSDGFVQLPANQGWPLMQAVASQGPIAVSVAAGEWFIYHGGIYDACPKDTVVNHAALLIGYGEEKSATGKTDLYWLLRNSWGAHWGEDGHMRLLRHTEDSAYCGTDVDPQAGTGCANGPESVVICGMCGILSDSSYPVGVRLPKGSRLA